MNMPLVLLNRRRRGGGFSPATLFALAEPGVWYDPSDFSTLYQDNAGTTPVTAVEQSVGLVLDKSKGLVLGPELVTNGDFSNGTTGWTAAFSTLSNVSNQLRVTNSGAAAGRARQSLSTVVGRTYAFRVDAYLGNSSSIRFRVLDASLNAIPASDSGGVSQNSVGTVRYFVATTTTSTIELLANDGVSGNYADFDNISVKELAGTHATQPTAASRPVLSARYNLLTATATLATQSVTTTAGDHTLRFEGAGSITLSGAATGSYNAGTHTITTTAASLTLTVSGTVTNADLRRANDGMGLPAYQAVTNSTTYDTVGFPPYLRFDGSDDFLVTNTITPGIDKVQVFAGVRKLSDALAGVLLELSATSASNNGSFTLSAPFTSANAGYGFGSRGTTRVVAEATTGFAAPVTNVITGIGDIAGDVSRLRANGAQIAADTTTDQGTGNFLAYPLYIGRRGGTSLPFNGRLYSLIVRFGANLTADQIAQAETWVNGKTKGY